MAECSLLQGVAAITAQICLATIAFSSLIYKRMRERPQRPLLVWTLDVSKQIVSMTAAHTCGLFIAILASASTPVHASECAWYAIAFTFDTSLGLVLTILLHKAAVRVATLIEESPSFFLSAVSASLVAASITKCGVYGTERPILVWSIQAAEWTTCVVIARAICGALVLIFGPILLSIADSIDIVFEGHPVALLYSVMILCPLIMNVIQMIIQDAVLKSQRQTGSLDNGLWEERTGNTKEGIAADHEGDVFDFPSDVAAQHDIALISPASVQHR